jgi:cysteine-rich repeat protein
MQNQNRYRASYFNTLLSAFLLTVTLQPVFAAGVPPVNNPPPRCMGFGNLLSISLTDWEAGLGTWTVGTHDVLNPPTFDTPDWAVVGSLPDGQTGEAAFVEDIESDVCGDDDETGALTLDSPEIVIPAGALVPRISIDHWFEIEERWDGGNLKVSVNGGAFDLVPASAIEFGSYTATLYASDDPEYLSTNPLAGQEAFTSTFNNLVTGSWIQSHVNLLGIATAGDSIRLRFDFGVDVCFGAIGWYVDDIELYSCEAELPPSDCGNEVLDPGEQCDDGNVFNGDGCSNICQIEDDWQCTAPLPPGTINDPGFESGTPNAFWAEVSSNSQGTPICDSDCGTGGGTGAFDGAFWAFFGGVPNQEGSVSQSVVIPASASELTFELEVPVCASPADFVEVLIDGNQEFLIDGSSPLCGTEGYSTQSVDVSAYANDGAHDLEFHSVTGEGISNFFIDAIAVPGSPSVCTSLNPGEIIFEDGFESP